MLATRIRKDGRVRLAMSTLKTSHLRITLLSYNFSWNNDVKQYLWLLNYTESPLGCSGKCNVSVALGHAVATAAQEIFEAIRAWWKESLVLNNKKKKGKKNKNYTTAELREVFFRIIQMKLLQSQIRLANSSSFYVFFHYSSFCSQPNVCLCRPGLSLFTRGWWEEGEALRCFPLPCQPQPWPAGTIAGRGKAVQAPHLWNLWHLWWT